MLPSDRYGEAGMDDHYVLANISDFNTLIAHSQQVRKPVYSLTQADVGRQGKLWGNTENSIKSFRQTFSELANKIDILTR